MAGMELRHLRYFVAIAEEGHVTRAAARLGIAQPPLSQQMQALERELGVTLLHRLPRGVALTAAGAAFLREARQVLEGAARAAVAASDAANGEAGRIAIGATTSAILHPLVAQVISDLALRTPRVAISIREGNAADLTEALAARALNVAFLRAPVAWPEGVRFEHILTEPILAVLPAGHILAQRGGTVALTALAGERFLLTRRPLMPGMYDDFLRACRAVGFEPQVAAEVERMLTNVNLVAAGMGVSVVPAAMRAIRLRGVRYMRLSGAPGLVAPLTVATRTEDDSPVLANLLARLAERRDAAVATVS